jgi:predicted membrane channel-forming protein YqfA (hemolysin III family)
MIIHGPALVLVIWALALMAGADVEAVRVPFLLTLAVSIVLYTRGVINYFHDR